MIEKGIIDAIVDNASMPCMREAIKEVLNSLSFDYDYDDNLKTKILLLCCGKGKLRELKDINEEAIEECVRKSLYKPDGKETSNYKIINIDNIRERVRIMYDLKENGQEYKNQTVDINISSFPQILKMS